MDFPLLSSIYLNEHFVSIQVCFGSDVIVTKERIRDDINGVGDQFVDDFMQLYETCQVNREPLVELVSETYTLNQEAE